MNGKITIEGYGKDAIKLTVDCKEFDFDDRVHVLHGVFQALDIDTPEKAAVMTAAAIMLGDRCRVEKYAFAKELFKKGDNNE